jgi:hypothetical protein
MAFVLCMDLVGAALRAYCRKWLCNLNKRSKQLSSDYSLHWRVNGGTITFGAALVSLCRARGSCYVGQAGSCHVIECAIAASVFNPIRKREPPIALTTGF